MSGKTNRVSSQVLGRFTGSAAGAFGSPVYVNLLTVSPANDGTVGLSPTPEEWTADRVAVYPTVVAADAAGSDLPYWGGETVVVNLVEISNQRTIGWDSTALAAIGTNITVISVGVFETLADDDLLYWDDLTNPRIVNNGDTFQFGVGKLKIRED